MSNPSSADGRALPELPEPFIGVQHNMGWRTYDQVIQSAIGQDGVISCFTADQMRAYVLADRASLGAAQVPKWIDDPHDIEQGQMLNPAWLSLHGVTAREAQSAGAAQVPSLSDAEIDALLNDLDEVAREACHYDYGLPMHDPCGEKLRSIVRNALSQPSQQASE